MRRTDDIESDDEREIIVVVADVVVTWTLGKTSAVFLGDIVVVVVVHATPLFEEKNGTTDAVRRGERTVHFGVARRTRSRTAHI